MAETEPEESNVVGQAAKGVATAGLAPLPKWLDQDGNGLADWQEPPVLIRAMGFLTGFITSIAPSHTVAYRYADFYRQQVLPRLEAAAKGDK